MGPGWRGAPLRIARVALVTSRVSLAAAQVRGGREVPAVEGELQHAWLGLGSGLGLGLGLELGLGLGLGLGL